MSPDQVEAKKGSFFRYWATDYVQQKKQYNQTIKSPVELYCLVPLFLLWWRYLQEDLKKACFVHVV